MGKAKAKTDIKGLAIPGKVSRGRQYVNQMRGNTQLPAGVGDAEADIIEAATDDLEAKNTAQLRAKDHWSIAVDEQTDSANNWDNAVNGAAIKITVAADGNPEIILSTGFGVAETPGTTLPAPAKVMNLHLSVGDEPGHVDVAWDGQEDATGYALQLWLGDDVTQASWNYGPPIPGKKSKLELLGQPSGSRLWARIQATNTHIGPWSDPISIIVP